MHGVHCPRSPALVCQSRVQGQLWLVFTQWIIGHECEEEGAGTQARAVGDEKRGGVLEGELLGFKHETGQG